MRSSSFGGADAMKTAFVEAMPIAAVVWRLEDVDDDDSLTLVVANRAAGDLLGIDPIASRGKRMSEVLPHIDPKHRTLCAQPARTPMATTFLGDVVSATDPDVIFTLSVFSLPDFCVGQLSERLTARRDAERDARKFSAFLDSIIENIPLMVFVKEAKTLRFELFNRAGEELLGLPREALLGKNDYDFFPKEQADFFQHKDRSVLSGNAVLDIPEEPIETPRGQRWLHTKKIPLGDHPGEPKYLLGISEDITARKESEAALRRAHRELEERVVERTAALSRANAELTQEIADRRRAEDALRDREEQLRQAQKMEAIGRLAGGVAHDFNNLLSIILSYGEMVAGALKVGDPLRGDVEQISIAGTRARELTRQLLAFSRQQVMKPEVFDLAAVVGGLEPMLGRLLGEDIELRILAGESVGLVKADPGQIEQIILNLVVNARDALPKGGKLNIEISDAVIDDIHVGEDVGVKPGPYVMLAVTDDGAGMDKAVQARIFEPFFTTKVKGKGTGLGLSTVFGIVRQSEGHIWVYSEPGQGTTFRIYFPRTTEPLGQSSLAPLSPLGARRQGNETILLVEDEEQVRVLARDLLRRNGYQVMHARNAEEATLLSDRHPGTIQLLLTDVVMPQVGGPELARRLLLRRPGMKVLFMSGYTDDAIVHHGILKPGTDFLEKPITPDVLLNRVRDSLDRPAPVVVAPER